VGFGDANARIKSHVNTKLEMRRLKSTLEQTLLILQRLAVLWLHFQIAVCRICQHHSDSNCTVSSQVSSFRDTSKYRGTASPRYIEASPILVSKRWYSRYLSRYRRYRTTLLHGQGWKKPRFYGKFV